MALSILFPEHHLASLLAPQFPLCRKHPRAVRLLEDDTSYHLTAAIPGAANAKAAVGSLHDRALKLTAYNVSGDVIFNETLTLPEDADLASMKVNLADGLLEAHVQKRAPLSVPVLPQAAPTAGDDVYELCRGLPGLGAGEVEVKASNWQLHIKAISTRGYKSYEWATSLPEDVDMDNVVAYCTHGMLTVHLPRIPPSKLQVLGQVQELEGATELASLMVPGYAAEDVEVTVGPSMLLEVKLQAKGCKDVVHSRVQLPRAVTRVDGLRAVCVDGMLAILGGVKAAEAMEVEVTQERPAGSATGGS